MSHAVAKLRSRPPARAIDQQADVFETADADGYIYCYYFPYVRSLARKAGKKRWPCKIGRTKNDVKECVAGQFIQSGIFELPSIGFVAHVKDHVIFENAIHARLNSRKLKAEGSGDEWFETNLNDVRRIFREIYWPGLGNLPRRLWVALVT